MLSSGIERIVGHKGFDFAPDGGHGGLALPEDLRLDAEVSAGFTIRVDDAD